VLLRSATAGAERPPPPPPPPPAADAVTFGLEAAIQPVFQHEPFWGLAQVFAASADYDSDVPWAEFYVKPSLRAEWPVSPRATAYGGAALIGTATLGEDVFLQGDTGRLSIEEAYLGLRGTTGTGVGWDVSAGRQPWKLGEGLLLRMGAGNGFERGAVTTAARRAWEFAGVANVSVDRLTVGAFYLDPDELQSGETGTKIAGARVEWASQPRRGAAPGAPTGTTVGLAWFEVLRSTAPYPQAPVQIIEGGRDGTRTLDASWRIEPASGPLAGLSISGEAAWQRNPRVGLKAEGWGAEVAWRFSELRWMPRISWSPRYFSGDDPRTADRLERFDALFYDGAPGTWSSGGNGSLTFYNSNLRVDRLRVDLVLSGQDFLNINYWDVRAARVDSPVQYGQAARLQLSADGATLVSGFPRPQLSREVYVEHTHVFGPRLFVTWGVAAAFPRAGVDALVPGGGRDWWGALANFTYKH
jgi:hypothetical protein